ncbi:SSU ribosomal protein S19E [Staphylothermus marinus F1]|uniref:Small ribosomal subunit protein eS19 n=1 Tax=Staphylothermus marinus (strain ATCC 43588 / DSM 3639 / JCM 9404 / F1) TaxID=399550 RepID=A3DNH1_STAMF|nr:30S ribosomal protein S19e [Staphylothermus marinus]ABN70181.1 SSU ribosomal protein S19E [Staphylothermus marinus F1]
MVTALEVPADKLIARLATYLKENVPEVKPLPWAYFVKTGAHKERPPQDPDWWYYRAASILRKLYKSGEPIGIETFRTIYGGRKNYGSAPEHFVKSGGSIIRRILQQLEQARLVRKIRGRGRILTPQGRALLDRLAYEVMLDLVREQPELAKYLPPSVRSKIYFKK